MLFTCFTNNLLSTIKNIEKSVNAKTNLSIINNILIETIDDNIKLSSNNLELGMEIIIPATIMRHGKILIPIKHLNKLLTKLPDVELTIQTNEDNTVEIGYDQVKYNLNGINADDFLMLSEHINGHKYSINTLKLKNMIKSVIFAVSTDETQCILNGAYFNFNHIDENTSILTMIASDGYRIAKVINKIEMYDDNNTNFVIPTKTLNIIYNMITNKAEENIYINFLNNQVSFRYKNIYLITKIIQGEFPNFNDTIQQSAPTTIIINREYFLNALEKCSIINSVTYNVVKFKIYDNKLLIKTLKSDIGEISEILDIEIEGKNNITVLFNSRIFIEVLKTIKADTITLYLSGVVSPSLIKFNGIKNYKYIIMPVKDT